MRFKPPSLARKRPSAGRDSFEVIRTRPPTRGEAAGLLEDIWGILRAGGPQVGAYRSAQALGAGLRTAAGVLTEGEAPFLLEALGALASGNLGGPLQDEAFAKVLRRLFENLGATYIKLGQFIASSPTLFPEAYVREFQRCLDRTEAAPYWQIERIVEEDLGRPVGEVFASFDEVPLASASVAQVHRAVLATSGEEVVVKVRKPGVREVLEVDLGFLYIAARLLGFLSPALSRSSLGDIVAEIRSSMLNETDFRLELQNLETFRRFLAESQLTSSAAAPMPYPEVSSERVLVMERLEGVPLADLDGLRTYRANPEAALISALNVWALSVRNCELFHADVHAGNLLVLRDGRIGFVDFGIVGRVPSGIWQAVESFGAAVVAGDTLGVARALIAMGATADGVDEAKLADDLEAVMERMTNLSPKDVSFTQGSSLGGVTAEVGVDEAQVTDLLLDIVHAAEDNGLKLPREFALLVKQALYFDRYNRLLAPDLNPLRDSRVDLGLSPSGPGPYRTADA